MASMSTTRASLITPGQRLLVSAKVAYTMRLGMEAEKMLFVADPEGRPVAIALDTVRHVGMGQTVLKLNM